MTEHDVDITQLLQQAKAGDSQALAALFEALYPELRRIARRRLVRDSRDMLLDTTSLVHECYVKFAGSENMQPADRVHFLAYSAVAMRTIVVDFARARLAERRGGGAQNVTLNSIIVANQPAGEDEVLAVHEALDELATVDSRLARVVEMRYFGGLDDAAIAEVLEVGVRTVQRDWQKARLLLSASMRK
jgi:RNA polymerase sigma factor (TIGR02999 family)